MSQIKIFCDGASRGNPGPAAAAFVVLGDKNKAIHEHSQFLGRATNNFAEYQAVLLAHQWLFQNTDKIRAAKITFCLDSELITKQLNGQYKIKSPTLRPLAIKINHLKSQLKANISYIHVTRSKNKRADFLANQALNVTTSKSSRRR